MRYMWSMLVAIGIAVSAWLALGQPGVAQNGPLLLVSAQDVAFLADAGDDATGTAIVGLASTEGAIHWTATISPTVGWLRLGVTQGIAPTGLAEPDEMQLYMQSLGLPRGAYSTNIVITTVEQVINAPVLIPVTLYVVDEIRRVHLPLILRNVQR